MAPTDQRCHSSQYPSQKSTLSFRYTRIIRDRVRVTLSRRQTPPRPTIRAHAQACKVIDIARQRMCCKVTTVGVRVDIETAVVIAAEIDAHGIESGVERIAAGSRKAERCLQFFAFAAWVREDTDSLYIYLRQNFAYVGRKRLASEKHLRDCGVQG